MQTGVCVCVHGACVGHCFVCLLLPPKRGRTLSRNSFTCRLAFCQNQDVLKVVKCSVGPAVDQSSRPVLGRLKLPSL